MSAACKAHRLAAVSSSTKFAVITRPIAEGLLDKLPSAVKAHPTGSFEIEQAIPRYSPHQTTHGPLRVAQELPCKASNVSGAVCGGNGTTCSPRSTRWLRLEKTHREQTIESTDEQIACSNARLPEFRERQIEVHYTENWWRSTPLRRRAWGLVRCICKTVLTAILKNAGRLTAVRSRRV